MAGDLVDVVDVLEWDTGKERGEKLDVPFGRKRKSAGEEASGDGNVEKPAGPILKSNSYADTPTDHVFLDVTGMIEGHPAHPGHVFIQCARKRRPALVHHVFDVCPRWQEPSIAQQVLEIRI